jgi:uncharacterized membrane protein YdjX (TVP38/TMEM64 family)
VLDLRGDDNDGNPLLRTLPKAGRLLMHVTHEIVEWLQHLGELRIWSALALGLFFSAVGLVVLPRTPLIVAAGATFGLAAAPIILVGGTFGSIVAFLLSRSIAASRFQGWLERHPPLQAVAHAVDLEGWKIVALLRLGVPIPNAATNYMLGLTRIGFFGYVAATMIFSIPQIVLFCFVGSAGRATRLDGSNTLSSLLSIVLAVALITLISWRVRLILRKSVPSQG